jgi:hypothetical protein
MTTKAGAQLSLRLLKWENFDGIFPARDISDGLSGAG